MSLFFKTINEDLLRDPGDDLKKLLRFRDIVTQSNKVLYEVFEDENDFARLGRLGCLSVIGKTSPHPCCPRSHTASARGREAHL